MSLKKNTSKSKTNGVKLGRVASSVALLAVADQLLARNPDVQNTQPLLAKDVAELPLPESLEQSREAGQLVNDVALAQDAQQLREIQGGTAAKHVDTEDEEIQFSENADVVAAADAAQPAGVVSDAQAPAANAETVVADGSVAGAAGADGTAGAAAGSAGAAAGFGGMGAVLAGALGLAVVVGSSDSSSATPTPTPTPTPVVGASVNVLAAKGILSGSKVFYDFDGDGKYTDGVDPFGTSGSGGRASIVLTDAQKLIVEGGKNSLGQTLKLIVTGGKDLTTGQDFKGSLSSIAKTDTNAPANVNVFTSLKAAGMSDALLAKMLGGRNLDDLTADDFNNANDPVEAMALNLWNLVSDKVGEDADATSAAMSALSSVLKALDAAGGNLNTLLGNGVGSLSPADLESLVGAAVDKAMALYQQAIDSGVELTAAELAAAMADYAAGLDVAGYADGFVTQEDKDALGTSLAKLNEAPILTGAAATLVAGAEDTAYTVTAADLLKGFTDIDGNTLSVTGLTASNASVVANQDGTYTITPTANFNGAVALSYGVFDGTATVAATQSFTIAAVNDAATGDLTVSGLARVFSAVTADLANVVDVDGLTTTSYQWEELVGGVWTPITGANAATFDIPANSSYAGKEVRAVATTTEVNGGATTTFTGAAQTVSALPSTVTFAANQMTNLLAGTDAQLDVLINQLQAAGMDTLALDATQVADLADADFSFDAGTDISVVGTSFLNASSGSAGLIGLLGAANVSVEMDAPGFNNLLADVRGDAALDGLVDQLHAAGMDTLVLGAAQAVELAAADFSFELGTDITVVGTSFLHADNATAMQLHHLFDAANVTTSLGLSDVQSDYASLSDLGNALYGLQDAAFNSGIDQFAMTDDLTNALADALTDADASFLNIMQNSSIGIDLLATSDVSDGTAYLNATLQDMESVGVENVFADAGVTKIEVALRDANETGSLQFSLADLPQFNVSQDMVVSLAVDEDDLAALLDSLNGDATDLASSGITDINYTGDAVAAQADLSELAATLASSGLDLSVATLTPTEVQLLGLGAEPLDPLDPFHKA